MNLPQNTTYSKENVASVVGAMKNVGKKIKQHYKPRKVDTSQYQGLANQVKSYAPSNIKGIGTQTTKYGESTKFEKFHPGIDYTKGMGSPVKSWTGGKVAEVVTGKEKGAPAFGNYVVVIDNQGNKFRYSHLQNGYVPFQVGQQIRPGDVIGKEGATGQTYSLHGGTGAHVDFRAQSPTGQYFDPMQVVNAYRKLYPNF